MPLTRYKPLAPGPPLKRTGPLAKRSKKQAAKNRQQQVANKEVDATQPHYCIACGCSYNLSRSHVLTRKQFPQLAANSANMVYLCWGPDGCHMMWEHDKPRFASTYPDAFAQKMKIMQALAPQYYAVFRMKNPHLFHS